MPSVRSLTASCAAAIAAADAAKTASASALDGVLPASEAAAAARAAAAAALLEEPEGPPNGRGGLEADAPPPDDGGINGGCAPAGYALARGCSCERSLELGCRDAAKGDALTRSAATADGEAIPAPTPTTDAGASRGDAPGVLGDTGSAAVVTENAPVCIRNRGSMKSPDELATGTDAPSTARKDGT